MRKWWSIGSTDDGTDGFIDAIDKLGSTRKALRSESGLISILAGVLLRPARISFANYWRLTKVKVRQDAFKTQVMASISNCEFTNFVSL
mmetsp:Transcript_29066/g.35439  ORF Transcript_29066/g.35439 Transcript_29066/m.35439 type:complete len:89 (+) Transcript_29066:436-702(+)